jgi:hypothetical protein
MKHCFTGCEKSMIHADFGKGPTSVGPLSRWNLSALFPSRFSRGTMRVTIRVITLIASNCVHRYTTKDSFSQSPHRQLDEGGTSSAVRRPQFGPAGPGPLGKIPALSPGPVALPQACSLLYFLPIAVCAVSP